MRENQEDVQVALDFIEGLLRRARSTGTAIGWVTCREGVRARAREMQRLGCTGTAVWPVYLPSSWAYTGSVSGELMLFLEHAHDHQDQCIKNRWRKCEADLPDMTDRPAVEGWLLS